MGRDYDKYENLGDIHWQWYSQPDHQYKTMVDEALKPFAAAELGTVIDVGCGDGLPLSFLDGLGFRCSGVDSNEAGIQIALEHGVSAEFFIEQAEKFAARQLEFDYLFSLNTIEHLQDPKCMVKMMANVGKFGVIVTDVKRGENLASEYHSREFTDGAFRELFSDFDLEPLQISDPNYFGYIIKKK